jgi:hypothetical protein
MDITEFFQQSVGKWFSQRTSHDISGNQSLTGQSDLWVDLVPVTDGVVVDLCQQHGIDAAQACISVNIRWEGKLDGHSQPQTGSMLWVAIADADPGTGKILRRPQAATGLEAPSYYCLGSDDALTLTTETPTATTTERVWFESPSLRFRTSIIQHPDGTQFGSFCSEIRMGGAKPSA